ncbi:MAG TPA: PilX N-terminal domain-containing pilus assembly protein [Vicinamibacteria bacterium]|nr:PilX N-terminal domain-containing pilus assembly protein [Vicinamibacteria bacterium]
MHTKTVEDRDAQGGFALILAILSLLLLTFLGLTLATTTSTELQIANNYRWSQQARYNAEAGLHAAKSLLRGMDWNQVMPAVRAATWNGITAPGGAGGGAAAPQSRNDEWGNPSRNFENWACDERGNGLGYGVVLDDGGAAGPHQYRSTIFGQNVNGAFTLWVRRPTERRPDGLLGDYGLDNDTLILVAEGVAPFSGGGAGTIFGQSNQSVQVVEAVLSRATAVTTAPCGTRGGQAGGGPDGAGFSGCDPITGGGLAPALGDANTGDRGGLVDTGVQ